jgi:hypothetical protein
LIASMMKVVRGTRRATQASRRGRRNGLPDTHLMEASS